MTEHVLVATDVVDSTAIAGQVGDARMAAMWVAHDRAVRDLLLQWRGREVDRTDGFLLVFDGTADALAFCEAFHPTMVALAERFEVPFTARAAIHKGPVRLIETPERDREKGAKPLELLGEAKDDLAVVVALAPAGRTLLTGSAATELADASLGTLHSHGHWKLKGRPEPIVVFEATRGGSPSALRESPAAYQVKRDEDLWLPAHAVPHGLTRDRTTFVGRTADLTKLSGLMTSGTRLATVLGTGGTGKTRLVTRYAWSAVGDFPGGVWFCDLTDARDVAGIVAVVARALGVPLGLNEHVHQLGHAIAGRGRVLVILDNFEQVARHAEATLGRWLERAPEAQFIVTTREMLGIRGEVVCPLAPMPQAEAETLFRALALAQGPPPDDATDEATIADLVRALDRLPLAIQLAAAQTATQTPGEILSGMAARFTSQQASGERRDRQATLRATLDWSWDLLEPDEGRALAQLSVFEGGFHLDAAEAVLELDTLWAMDALDALVRKSLVVRPEDRRYDLLVSVKDYARHQLAQLGQTDATSQRHGQYFATYGADTADTWVGSAAADHYRLLRTELDNLVIAARRAVTRGLPDLAYRTARAAWTVFTREGPALVGIELLEEVIEMPGLAPAAKAWSAQELARVRARQFPGTDVSSLLELGLTLARELQDPRLIGWCEYSHAYCLIARSELSPALPLLAHARSLVRESPPADALEVKTLIIEAYTRSQMGDMEAAKEVAQQCLRVATEQDRPYAQHEALSGLSTIAWRMGDLEGANQLLQKIDQLVQQGRTPYVSETEAMVSLGCVQFSALDYASAHTTFERALQVARRSGQRLNEAAILGNLADAAMHLGRLDEAERHCREAIAIHVEDDPSAWKARHQTVLAEIRLRLGDLPDAHRILLEAEPVLRDAQDGFELGKALALHAFVHHSLGQLVEASTALDEASRIATTIGVSDHSELAQKIATAESVLRGAGEVPSS